MLLTRLSQRGLVAEGGLDEVPQLDPEVKDVDRLRHDQAQVQRQLQPAAGEDQVRQRTQAVLGGVVQGHRIAVEVWLPAEAGRVCEGGRILVARRGVSVARVSASSARCATLRGRRPGNARPRVQETCHERATHLSASAGRDREERHHLRHGRLPGAVQGSRDRQRRRSGPAWRASTCAGRRPSPRRSTTARRRSSSGSRTAR